MSILPLGGFGNLRSKVCLGCMVLGVAYGVRAWGLGFRIFSLFVVI